MLHFRLKTSAPFLHSGDSVQRRMGLVLLALSPLLLLYLFYFGLPFLLRLLFVVVVAPLLEGLWLLLLKKDRATCYRRLMDGSALVTGLLMLALPIPSHLPLHTLFIGLVFALWIIKGAYGGLGHNLFNPALAGYVCMVLLFPRISLPFPSIPPLTP